MSDGGVHLGFPIVARGYDGGMRSIGSGDARTHLYRLLDDVAAGESIASNVDETLERFRALRKGTTLGGISSRELIDEGRKY